MYVRVFRVGWAGGRRERTTSPWPGFAIELSNGDCSGIILVSFSPLFSFSLVLLVLVLATAVNREICYAFICWVAQVMVVLLSMVALTVSTDLTTSSGWSREGIVMLSRRPYRR